MLSGPGCAGAKAFILRVRRDNAENAEKLYSAISEKLRDLCG
jgi:hypothetical protein